jgi:PAS domain S-box-containing protein
VKIRAKTILIIAITLIGLITVLYAASEVFVLKGFETVEEEDGRQNVERMVSALLNDINTLDSLTNEMASWNETVTLLEDGSLDDTWAKISDPTFERLGVNLILILDDSGKAVAGKAYDLVRAEAIPLPADLAPHLSSDGPLLNTTMHPSGTMGILALTEQPLLIASRPVFAHRDTGSDVVGTIVMGRYLDENEVTRISMITSLPVALYRYDATDLPPDVLDARTALSAGIPTFIERREGDTVTGNVLTRINPLDGDTLCGYAVIGDIYGEPTFLMRLAIPRDIYAQGTISTAYFVISLLAVGFIFGVLTLLLLDRTVLSRLSFLSTTVGTIESDKDFSTRVALPGRDEISSLATDINRMLDALETAQKRLEGQLVESEERYRLFFNSGNDAVYVFSVDDTGMPGRFIEVNDEACRKLGYDRSTLLCRSPGSIVGGDDAEIRRRLQELLHRRHVLYEATQQTRDGSCISVEINAHLVMHEGHPIVIAIARDISERKQIDELKRQAFEQIQKNYEQFAILNDQIRNPLQVIVGLAAMEEGIIGEKIMQNAEIIDGIVDELDQGWIESEKVRDFLKKYYG